MARYFWLLITTFSFAGDYIVTYRGVFYNGSLESEAVWIVPSLELSNHLAANYHICFSPTTSLKSLTQEEKSLLLSQLSSQGFFINDTVRSINGTSKSRTVLTYPPTRVRIDIDQDCNYK
jgi:hypothetical protein